MKLLLIFLFGLFFSPLDLTYFFTFLLFFSIYAMTLSMNSFFGILYMDSLSFFLVFLSFLIFMYCFLSSLIDKWNMNQFFGFGSILSFIFFCLFISFSCLNIFIFYVTFEFIFMLMFYFLLSWGYSPERLQASFYMVFYTILVSFPFLVFVILLGPSFYPFNFISNYIYEMKNFWWFFIFFVFLVKLPVYGVHLWLPKAHVEAPVSGSMVLAGVLLKLGGYGMLRFSYMCNMTLTPKIGYLVSIGLVGSVASCFLCMRQSDLKSLVAYSSICHMGFGLAGIFSLSFMGKTGGIYMMIAHGFCSSCFFYILYILYERLHSRSIILIKGIIFMVPCFTLFWFIFSILNMGVPPSFSFFSEIPIIVGILSLHFISVLFVGMILFFAGIYCIILYILSCHGMMILENINYEIFSREYLNMYGHMFPLLFVPYYLEFFY